LHGTPSVSVAMNQNWEKQLATAFQRRRFNCDRWCAQPSKQRGKWLQF